jgi:hypothetical protein
MQNVLVCAARVLVMMYMVMMVPAAMALRLRGVAEDDAG